MPVSRRFRLTSLLVVVGTCTMCAAIVATLYSVSGALEILQVLSSVLVLVALLEGYRRLREDRRGEAEQLDRNYSQVEALFSLYFTLRPERPLPATRGWAASPDLLKTIMEVVLREQPNLVVEASSGVSTLVIAYCMKRLGKGKVVSLEHEAQFAALSQEQIDLHGLGDIATVVYAPLRDAKIAGKDFVWYDLEHLPIGASIDLLVVDGPPGIGSHLARYPALPLLHARLSDRATVVLDDGNRPDERAIAEMWGREYGDLSVEYHNLEKGAFVLRRGGQAAAAAA